MKKIIKILFALLLIFLFNKANVFADTNDTNLEKHTYEGYGAIYDGPDRVHLFYARRFTANGITSYCIEPGVPIDTNLYSSTNDWSITGLSNEIRNYIKLVAYYGYDYTGHQTMKYYMAAQELIWEKITGRSVYWVSELSFDGPELNVNAEKNEILNLINNHNKKPSFNDETIEINIGETKSITDTNGILSNYEIYNSDFPNVSISGNTLNFTATDKKIDNKIQLIKKSYTSLVNFIYFSGSNQKLISSGILDPIFANLNIKTISGSVEINKIGETIEFIDNSFQYNKVNLSGVKIGIFANEDIYDSLNNLIYEKNELIEELITNENGYASIEGLHFGKYYLKEIETVGNHVLDSEKYEFELINKESVVKINYNITLENYLSKGSLDFTKRDFITGEPLPNTKIQIFTNNDNEERKLIFEGYTDNSGKITIDNLFIGKFVLFEKEAPEGYILNPDPMEFEITSNSEIIKANMTNEKIKMPKTFNTDLVSMIISGSAIIIGSSLLIYAKKRKDK